MTIIYDILIGTLLGSASNSYKQHQKSFDKLSSFNLWLILLFNYYISAMVGYQFSLFAVHKWGLDEIGFIIAFVSSSLATNLFQALTKLDWTEIATKRLGGK